MVAYERHLTNCQEALKTTYYFLLLGFVCQTCAAKSTTSLLQTFQMLLHPFNILEPEFCRDNFHVTDGVDVSLDVDNVGIVEGTNHLEDTIDGTDVGQEGITKASTC